MTPENLYQARLLELFSPIDLDLLEPGAPFEATWTVKNGGEAAWGPGTELVYTDERYPETVDYPHSNLAGREAFKLTELGEGETVSPGDTAFLTLTMKTPAEPGTYLTGWQLRTAGGERFGPVLELRAVVIDPPEKGLGDLSYELVSFANSFQNYNAMPAGQAFSGTWTLRNTGINPWSGEFEIQYTPQKTADTNDATSTAMGAREHYRLGDLAGKETVAPGEAFQVRIDFTAPEQPGNYAFQWQLLDEAGQPFGGTRWMRIVVRRPDGSAPPPPALTGAYRYTGPAVAFFTGIHGPASDWIWGNNEFKGMMRRLGMPVFYWSLGANKDNPDFGDGAHNAVRLYWNPRPVSADEAYAEIRDGELRAWYDRGYRRFVFFNEPQFGKEIAGIEEGFGIAWRSADEFGRFLKAVLQRARAEFPGIKLYTTPMSSNAAFDPWHWYNAMWSQVQGLVDGWCMHAYTGDNANVEEAAGDIAGQVVELQRRFALQIPIIVSEASVNRGSDAQQKARVARRVHQKLSAVPGVEGVYWYAAEWDPASDKHHEGWFHTGIADAYLAQVV